MKPRKCILSIALFAALALTGCNQPVSGNLPDTDANVENEKGKPVVSPSSANTASTAKAESVSPSVSPSRQEATPSPSPGCTEPDDSGKVTAGRPASGEDSSSEEYASPEETEQLLQDVLKQLDSYDDSLNE